MPPAVADGMQAPPHRPSGRQIAGAVVLALAGFLLTAGVLHTAIVAGVRDPLFLYAGLRSEKLAMLRQWHGRVFSAAFGSSHVHNGFDPRAFDEALAGTPEATRSANLAVEGGAQPEQLAMAEQFVEQLVPPVQAGGRSQPCLVLLELGAGANFTPEHLVHPRAINLYSWGRMQLVSELANAQMGLRQRLGRLGYALAAMGLHYASVGMLSNGIFRPPLSASMVTEQTRDDRRGEDVLPNDAGKLADLQGAVRGRPPQPAISARETLPGNADLIRRVDAASAVRHLSFAYVLMPKLSDVFGGSEYPDHITVQSRNGSLEVPIVNLARADRYPQIYDDLHLWYDDAHLNGNGARVLSELLARQLTAWYAEHGQPKPCG